MRNRVLFSYLLLCLMLSTTVLVAQQPPASQGQVDAARTNEAGQAQAASDAFQRQPIGQNPHHLMPPQSPLKDEVVRKQRQALSQQNQEDLKRDADKLLQLTTELKQYLDGANQEVLSLEAVRKAEQIEKLARSVHKRMVNR